MGLEYFDVGEAMNGIYSETPFGTPFSFPFKVGLRNVYTRAMNDIEREGGFYERITYLSMIFSSEV